MKNAAHDLTAALVSCHSCSPVSKARNSSDGRKPILHSVGGGFPAKG
jgi:hypothetical protein